MLFGGPQTMKNTSLHSLYTVVPPPDCLDTIIDRFSGVRPMSLAAVFRRRSRHGRYMMTTITTVRRNAPLHTFLLLWVPGKLAIKFRGYRNSVPVRFLYFKLGMWRSSNSNSIAVEFRIILPHSTFVECWNCPVIECEFDSVDVRSTDLSHLEFVKDLNVNNFHFESGSQLHCA